MMLRSVFTITFIDCIVFALLLLVAHALRAPGLDRMGVIIWAIMGRFVIIYVFNLALEIAYYFVLKMYLNKLEPMLVKYILFMLIFAVIFSLSRDKSMSLYEAVISLLSSWVPYVMVFIPIGVSYYLYYILKRR